MNVYVINLLNNTIFVVYFNTGTTQSKCFFFFISFLLYGLYGRAHAVAFARTVFLSGSRKALNNSSIRNCMHFAVVSDGLASAQGREFFSLSLLFFSDVSGIGIDRF